MTEQYPRPSLAADVVALAFDGEQLRTLLIRRARAPFEGAWALPGGFVEADESAEQGAARELVEETGVRVAELEQLVTLSDPKRDPRGWVVSVVHLALLPYRDTLPAAGDDASAAEWVPVRSAKELAFDHDRALALALRRIAARAERFPFGAELLPERFTLRELQTLHEAVQGKTLDKRNFRKRVLGWPALVALQDLESDVAHRRARFYRFDRRRYKRWALAETGEPFG